MLSFEPAAAQSRVEPRGDVFSPIIGRHIELSRDRIAGSVQALMVADALGLPVETLTAAQIAEKFGEVRTFQSLKHNKYYVNYSVPDGSWSDDAQLSAALFDAFADAKGYSLKAIGDRHVEAFKESKAGWGGSTVAGVKALIDGIDPADPEFRQRLKSGTGNGIPMKIGAVAAYLAVTGGDDSEMVKMVTEISSLSHRTSMSVSAGLAHAAGLLYCYSCGPENFSAEKFVEIVSAASRLGRSVYPDTLTHEDITARLEKVGDVAKGSRADVIAAYNGGGCYVYDSIPFAYAFFLRNPLSFEAVIESINAGGDTDSNGAIVGSLQGALLGKKYVPQALLNGVHNTGRITKAYERFCDAFNVPA